MGLTVTLTTLTSSTLAFTVVSSSKTKTHTAASTFLHAQTPTPATFDPLELSSTNEQPPKQWKKQAMIFGAAWIVSPQVTHAAGPDWGLFEGKTGSLLHPIMMFAMAGFTVSTALLGFDWRRQRTIGDEISTLKKTLPKYTQSTLTEAIAAAEENQDMYLASQLKNAAPMEALISELTVERKEIAAKAPRDKHFSQGALLAFLGTAFAIEGPLNTYARAGKLFPGPHLYAGAGLVVCWALAAACVPSMQKGSDVGRQVHIGANVLGMGLFGWQVVSGIPILQKVWEKTQWP